jgi:hypothetical protein
MWAEDKRCLPTALKVEHDVSLVSPELLDEMLGCDKAVKDQPVAHGRRNRNEEAGADWLTVTPRCISTRDAT